MPNYDYLTKKLKKIMGDADYADRAKAYDICIALQKAGLLKLGRKKLDAAVEIIMQHK